VRDLARIVRQSKGRSWKSYGIVDVSLFFFRWVKKCSVILPVHAVFLNIVFSNFL